jgi:protein CpxP
MTYKFRHLIPSFVALSMAGVAGIAIPSTASALPAQTAAEKADAAKPLDHVETHINDLHTKLHITAAQESQWGKLASVMRDNAKEMSSAVEKHERAGKTISAIDDLKSYQSIAQAHADGLKNLVPAFEALYGVLSDAQKKDADAMFVHGVDHQSGHKS